MDKAPDYGSGDSRFESWRGRFSFEFGNFYELLKNSATNKLAKHLFMIFSRRKGGSFPNGELAGGNRAQRAGSLDCGLPPGKARGPLTAALRRRGEGEWF